jgi:hypothetical protein
LTGGWRGIIGISVAEPRGKKFGGEREAGRKRQSIAKREVAKQVQRMKDNFVIAYLHKVSLRATIGIFHALKSPISFVVVSKFLIPQAKLEVIPCDGVVGMILYECIISPVC